MDKAGDYNRRQYVVEGAALDTARRIELTVTVDGKQLVKIQAREPGLLAFVSKPSEQGFAIEVVEATGRRYVDSAVPGADPTALEPWQIAALGIEP